MRKTLLSPLRKLGRVRAVWRRKTTLLAVLALALLGAIDTRAQKGLQAEEVMAGWISLFDGETLFGWQSTGDGWKITPQSHLKATEDGTVTTTSPFRDFELRFDFKRSAVGKGDLRLRCDTEGICGASVPLLGTEDAWHSVNIRISGDSISALIGDQAVKIELATESKLGAIQLAVKGDCEFSEIRLIPTGSGPVEGWKPFPGKTGFFTLRKDGGISVEGGPAQLESRDEFSNFIVQFEAMIHSMVTSPDVYSGFLLRTTPGDLWSGYRIVLDNRFKDKDRKKPVANGTGGIAERQDARRVFTRDRSPMEVTVVANGRHIATWVNGYQEADWTDDSAEPRTKGVFALQAVEPLTNVQFRKIRVQELP